MLEAPFHWLDGQIAIDLPGARAVFTTRAWGDVRETQGEIAERLSLQLVAVRQVHGAAVVAAAEAAPTTEADAIISTAPGVAPMVRAADCLPIVIATDGVVAGVHAGWRGLQAGVIANAVTAVRRAAGAAGGTSALAIGAAIGPAAGACCYEVGPELHERFPGFSRNDNLDLKHIARAQLEAAGVSTIHDAGICTICSDPALLYSHRRDGAQTGRQAAIAWLS